MIKPVLVIGLNADISMDQAMRLKERAQKITGCEVLIVSSCNALAVLPGEPEPIEPVWEFNPPRHRWWRWLHRRETRELQRKWLAAYEREKDQPPHIFPPRTEDR